MKYIYVCVRLLSYPIIFIIYIYIIYISLYLSILFT